jgi:hypothetical protein
LKALKAGAIMARVAFDEAAFERLDADLMTRPNADLWKSSGLYLARRGRAAGIDFTAREEAYLSRLVEKVPGIQASNGLTWAT